MTTRRHLACFFLLATFAPEAQPGSLYSRLLIMLGMVEPFPGCLSLCCLLNLDQHIRQPSPCAPRKYPKHLPTCIPFLCFSSTSTGLYVCKLLGSIVPFILVFFLPQHHDSLHHISLAWVYFLFCPLSLYSHFYPPGPPVWVRLLLYPHGCLFFITMGTFWQRCRSMCHT